MPKILIIEDEEFLSDMYKFKFEHEGYVAVVAHNGPQGLELAKKELPDLVLLDLVLPGLNGFEVLAKLKKDAATKNIKVFIFSNLGQENEIDKGKQAGADGYFVKANMTPGQLMEKINAVFKNPNQAKNFRQLKPRRGDDYRPIEKKQTKILLIEDEETIANMYILRFQKSGFEIESARNGAWGLKLARQKKFDVIIMDMVMPAMNGYEAIKILKADEATKNVPIIILSNSAQDQDIELAKKLGAAACLLKSAITPAKLVNEVEKFI